MPSITSEASSSASSAASIVSTTSFQYSVADALSSPEYSLREGLAIHRVALGLQAVDGVEIGLRALHRPQPVDEGDRLVGHLHQQIGLLLQLRHRRDVAVPQLRAGSRPP